MQHQLVLDAIFGFSFTGNIRPPFDAIIQVPSFSCLGTPHRVLNVTEQALRESSLPIVSIDIPSGWDVERGNIDGQGLEPEMLISLTYPKECAKAFKGPHHFLGGRFIPPLMASQYGLDIPAYPGSDQCVRL